MSAGPTGLRWFVDETSLGLGKMLAIARTDVVHPGHYYLPSVPTGTLDTILMPIVAGLDLVVISRDKRIRTKPAELAAFRAAGLRVFWIAGKKAAKQLGEPQAHGQVVGPNGGDRPRPRRRAVVPGCQ